MITFFFFPQQKEKEAIKSLFVCGRAFHCGRHLSMEEDQAAGWGRVCPPGSEGMGSRESPARSPPMAQPPAHITSAAGRAVPLVNKCPLLFTELLQATQCTCPRPTALVFFVSISSSWEICPCARAPVGGEAFSPSCLPPSLCGNSHAQGTGGTEGGLTPDRAFAKHPHGAPPSRGPPAWARYYLLTKPGAAWVAAACQSLLLARQDVDG